LSSFLECENHLSVAFFSFFNRRGREEGTKNTEICQDIVCDLRGQEHSRVSGLKTQKAYTQIIFHMIPPATALCESVPVRFTKMRTGETVGYAALRPPC